MLNSKNLSLLAFLLIVIFVAFIYTARSVNFALAAKAFIVERVGMGKILVTDGISEYVIEHDYNCYDSDFYEGEIIYIDSYLMPNYGDKIIIPDYPNTICEVFDADEVNIERYYVNKVLDLENKIIVTDKNGTQFLVEYGTGCGFSMWKYEGKIIDIDVGGSFLDGIGDRIYLFDSGDDCKIWDAEELSSNNDYSFRHRLDINKLFKNLCPVNASYINGQCICNEGYINHNGKCITYTEKCKILYGENVYARKDGNKIYCYCKSGYKLNSTKTRCIKIIQKKFFK